MFRDDIGGSIIGQITVGVVLAVLVGGTSPWWWSWFKNNPNKEPVSPTGVGIVFNPESNVREEPNGKILCSVREKITINLYDEVGDWYATDVCGTKGFIHNSQIKF